VREVVKVKPDVCVKEKVEHNWILLKSKA
jgi:hypothetical protein